MWCSQWMPRISGRFVLVTHGPTTHQVSALDLTTTPLSFVDMHGERSTSQASFVDADGSGSDPDFMLVGVNDVLLENEQLQISFVGGTTRLYYPAQDSDGSSVVRQADTGDGATFNLLPGGAVLTGTQDWAAAGLGAGVVGRVGEELEALLAGESAEGVRSIGSARAVVHALDWTLAASPSLVPTTGGWDAAGLADPDAILVDSEYHVVYTGGAGLGRGIGHATGSSIEALSRSGNEELEGGTDGAVLLPTGGGFDSVSVGSPALVRRGDTGEFLLWYSGHADAGFDGSAGTVPAGLAIGLARSDDGVHYVRTDQGIGGTAQVLEPGPAGSWDSQAVTAASAYFDNGRFHLWYQGFDGEQWRVGRAVSIDGVQWTKDTRNPVFDEAVASRVGGVPQRAFALKASQGGYYRVEGDISGVVSQYAFEGSVYDSNLSPVTFEVVGGQALGLGEVGDIDADGVSSASAIGNGAVFYTGHAGSARRLAVGRDLGVGVQRGSAVRLRGFSDALAGLNGSAPSLPVTAAEARFGADGVTQVAFVTSGGIALAQGEVSVSKGETVLDAAAGGVLVVGPGVEGAFDEFGVTAPSLVLDASDGVHRLYYSGQGETGFEIGMLSSSDGLTWTREGQDGLVFERGPAGSWDDFSVQDPTVIWDEAQGLFLMWYVGSDGGQTRVGYASSSDGVNWQRHLDAQGVGQWVFDGAELPFVEGSALAPSVTRRADGYLEMWFEGQLSGVPRLGRARSEDGLVWAPVTNPTTAGDFFTLRSTRGDEDPQTGIDLGDNSSSPRFIDGFAISGAGASEMILSPDGHFGVIANKRIRFLVVVDLHDDSDEESGYIDANFNDIEAVIQIPQVHGMVGTRDMAFSSDGTELFVLESPLINQSSPETAFGTEAFLRLDWTQITDSDESVAIREGIVTGYLPLARGNERDQGYANDVSVGAGSMALSADDSRAYVLNFNDNSMYVLDLAAGARGAVVEIIRGLDENPWEVELSPDGRRAYVATSYGITTGSVQHSTLLVVDIDESSASFGEVITRLSNIGSRSEAGCE